MKAYVKATLEMSLDIADVAELLLVLSDAKFCSYSAGPRKRLECLHETLSNFSKLMTEQLMQEMDADAAAAA